jgi:hypothetical protein
MSLEVLSWFFQSPGGRETPGLRACCLTCQSAGKAQTSRRFGVHLENLGHVYFLY